MNASTIQKYKGKSIPWLRKKAGDKFRAFIRKRDEDKPCISCGGKVEQAGHFYSAGHHPALEFNDFNTNGQCVRCNYFLSGNLNEYRKNLIYRIGIERVKELDQKMSYFKKHLYKHDRFFLIEIIET